MNIFLAIFWSFAFLAMPSSSYSQEKIKEPNVAGQFYPNDPQELSGQIDDFMAAASVEPPEKQVKILIAPHAGYVYSGWVAAHGFKAAGKSAYKTIVILAPSHFYPFDAVSVWPEGAFRTPLGDVPVDSAFAAKLISADKKFRFEPSVYEKEHSLEVEIPFLQKTFTGFKIVPVIMGQPSVQLLQDFAKALKKVIGDRQDVLIVVSTDMSHYHDDASARAMDARTIEAVKALNAEQIYAENHKRTMEMCGFIPVTAALFYAREAGLTGVDVLKYGNSGDVTGDKERVVGYLATVIYEGKKESSSSLSLSQKRQLIDIAKETINAYVKNGKVSSFDVTDPRLIKVEGAFVTIMKKGRLRGCIGNIIGDKPLCVLVRDMAIAAAASDPRFPPVGKEELGDLEVEVSVLSVPRAVTSADEVKENIHGVVISRGNRHGVFLPQVWEDIPKKEEFLSVLCTQKAGLPADCWKDPETEIEVFTADVFSEKDVQRP